MEEQTGYFLFCSEDLIEIHRRKDENISQYTKILKQAKEFSLAKTSVWNCVFFIRGILVAFLTRKDGVLNF